MKNLKILLSVLLATAMLLTAASALAEGYSVDVLEVKIWDNNQLAGLQQIADLWTEQSGVKVNIQVVDWDNYWTLLEAGASGGEMPDVFWMHSNNAQMYMGAQKLLDLTDYIAASDKIDLANYYPGITELYSLNDRNYAIAKDHDTITLIFIPPYTPEMNPIEQIWKGIRKRGFRNEIFHSLDKVIDRLCDVIINLPASAIQSITGRQWILSMF